MGLQLERALPVNYFENILPLLPAIVGRIPAKIRVALYGAVVVFAAVLLVGPTLGMPTSALVWRILGGAAAALGLVAAPNVAKPVQVIEGALEAVQADTTPAAPATPTPSAAAPAAPAAAPSTPSAAPVDPTTKPPTNG